MPCSILRVAAWYGEKWSNFILCPGIFLTNVFNGLDTRVGSTTNSVTRTFLRDGAYMTDPVLRDSTAIYTPGISERQGAVTTFLHSGLKNADAQSGSAQNLTASRAYDAFGKVLSSSGAWQGPFGYAGAFGYQEDATGLMLLGHRLYDPSTGRFLTRDPIRDGRNWYVYCGNDPNGMTDFSRLAAAAVLPWAVGAPLVDGPLPVGDIAAGIIIGVGGFIVFAEPKNRKRKSTQEKHHKGQTRIGRDAGGEKGDARRNQNKKKEERPGPKTLLPGEFDEVNRRWH